MVHSVSVEGKERNCGIFFNACVQTLFDPPLPPAHDAAEEAEREEPAETIEQQEHEHEGKEKIE